MPEDKLHGWRCALCLESFPVPEAAPCSRRHASCLKQLHVQLLKPLAWRQPSYLKPCPLHEAPPSFCRQAPCLKARPMSEVLPHAWILALCLLVSPLPEGHRHAQCLRASPVTEVSRPQWLKSCPVNEVIPKATPRDWSQSHSQWRKLLPKSLPMREAPPVVTPHDGSHSRYHSQWLKSLAKSLPVKEFPLEVTPGEESHSRSHSQWLKSKSHSVSAVTPSDCSPHSQWLKSSLPVPEVGTPSAWRNCRGRTEREGDTEFQAASRLCGLSTETPGEGQREREGDTESQAASPSSVVGSQNLQCSAPGLILSSAQFWTQTWTLPFYWRKPAQAHTAGKQHTGSQTLGSWLCCQGQWEAPQMGGWYWLWGHLNEWSHLFKAAKTLFTASTFPGLCSSYNQGDPGHPSWNSLGPLIIRASLPFTFGPVSLHPLWSWPLHYNQESPTLGFFRQAAGS